MKIKAKLFVIGGGEDKGTNKDRGNFAETGILARIVKESRLKEDSRIEIVTSASKVPEEIGEDYIQAFGRLNAKNVGVFIMKNREDASDNKNLDRLKNADVVFVTGGDQLRLTATIGGSAFFDVLSERLTDPDFIYAGTSAGATSASNTMIISGRSEDAIYKGEIETASGFGLMEDIIFDTHFIQRGRIGRLFQVIVSNPKSLGVGLEENTALFVRPDRTMEAVGTGMVILVDGRHIKETNLLDIKAGTPISITNLILHVMSETDVYDLKTNELHIINPEEYKI
jgi:cyanophycinase